MKLAMYTTGGKTIKVEVDAFVYLTIKDDEGEKHVRLLTDGVNGDEVRTLRALLAVVGQGSDD